MLQDILFGDSGYDIPRNKSNKENQWNEDNLGHGYLPKIQMQGDNLCVLD
jgi:hypothetical protein